MLDRVIQAVVNVAASAPVFLAATAVCVGWLTGWLHTTGVFQPSGVDGILTFWLGFAILRSTSATQRATFVYMQELVRAVPEARNEIVGIEHRPAHEIAKAAD